MAKEASSALVDAAAQFHEQLAIYARLGEVFLKTPLTSVKHLERANLTLGEIAACEERLQTAGQQLVQALSTARSQQETLSQAVVAHVPEVQARNAKLNELMNQLTGVAGEVGGLNSMIGAKENGDQTKPPTPADARDVSETVLGLSDKAAELAATANEAEFEELASQAHALHQRLQAIGKKLQKAGSGS